jgi:hypothetical protein
MERIKHVEDQAFMSIEIQLPDPAAETAGRVAERLGMSIADLCALAVQEYAERHDPQSITERLDAVVADTGATEPAFAQRAARRLAERVEW